MIWGSTFLVIQLAMRHSGPLFFVGLRFTLAGLLCAALVHRRLAGLTRLELIAGGLIGLAIFLGYGLQTYGLQTITSSQSAFITALYVPLVPLLQWSVMGSRPHAMSFVGVAFAFIGLLLLAGPDAGFTGMSRGEWATVIGALAIAFEVLLIGIFARRVDVGRVTAVQLLVAGLLGLLLRPVAGETIPAYSPWWLFGALGLAASSVLIQWTINWAQRSVSPTRATLIYAGEPVWGGVVGRLAGDRLPGIALIGAALIIVGPIISEWRPGRRAIRMPAPGAGTGAGTEVGPGAGNRPEEGGRTAGGDG